MSFSVHILRRASADADCIYAWLADRSPSGAARWYAAYLKATYDLANDPRRHPVTAESPVRGHEVRQRFFKTRRGRLYQLLFTLVGNEVRVLRVRGPGQTPVTLADLDV